jgi:hypothetical protein
MRSKPIVRTLFAALLLAAFAVAASAQTTQVNGTVKLRQADGTEVPVVGAQIDIYRTDIKGAYHTKTDKKGHYIHAGLPFIGTYTIIVSAPGARPTFATKLRFNASQQRDFLLQPGDGTKLTLEEVTKLDTSKGSAPADPYDKNALPAAESKEDKAKREEMERKIKEVEAKNAEILKSNEAVNAAFKAGNDALFAKPARVDEAITHYRQGLAARPDEVALLTNLAEALRLRGDERFNTAVKSTDNDAKLQGLEAAKKDWTESAAMANKAVEVVKTATPTSENVNAAAFDQNRRAAFSVRALAMRRVASKVDQSQAAAALAANQEFMEAETDPAKKAKLKTETLQMLFDANASDLVQAEAQKMLTEDPDNPDANRILGLALYATGDKAKYQQAANHLQRYVDKAQDTDPLKASTREALEYLKTAENIKPEKAPSRPARRRP